MDVYVLVVLMWNPGRVAATMCGGKRAKQIPTNLRLNAKILEFYEFALYLH